MRATFPSSTAAPAALCSDAVFLRRAYLDVIGTLPTGAEARDFLLDRSPDKRRALIERLLTSLPVSESEAAREELNASPGRISDLIMMTPEQDEARADWAAAAARQLDEADRALAVLERRAKGMRP